MTVACVLVADGAEADRSYRVRIRSRGTKRVGLVAIFRVVI